MKRTLVSLHDQSVELACPPGIASDVEFLYRDSIANGASAGLRIVVEEASDGRFSVAAGEEGYVH